MELLAPEQTRFRQPVWTMEAFRELEMEGERQTMRERQTPELGLTGPGCLEAAGEDTTWTNPSFKRLKIFASEWGLGVGSVCGCTSLSKQVCPRSPLPASHGARASQYLHVPGQGAARGGGVGNKHHPL